MLHVRRCSVLAAGLMIGAVALSTGACAATGLRNQARVGAVTFSHLAHDVKVTEDQIFAAGIPQYDKATHLKVQQGIKTLLLAAKAYDQAVAGWKAGESVPHTVIDARAGFNDAISTLVQVVPAIGAVKDPMNRAIAALAAALASQSAAVYADEPLRAEAIPTGGIMGLFALLSIAMSLFTRGRMTFGDLAGFLRSKGATDEELAAAEAVVDADVKAIDDEAAAAVAKPTE